MFKFLFAAILILSSFFQAPAFPDAHEYAPLLEKDLTYENWEYKDVKTNQKIDLREFAADKKLVMVVYFAPWCHNSNYQAPVIKKLYDKYKHEGFAVIGVGLYASSARIEDTKDRLELDFPVVTDSSSTKDREKTLHYKYRIAVGDTRKWGTPWNLFFDPQEISGDRDVITTKPVIVNGEVRLQEAEYFIRKKLGLPPETAAGN
ncbi:MAG: TlpA disulfide reductase family protein [Pyrinomonadaceae bacterium]